jgi:hypothetical protein
VSSGAVHDDFDGRPAAYFDPETLKIVVLMTDGENTRQYDLHERYRSGPSPFWRDPDNGDISVYYEAYDEYWQVAEERWSDFPDGGSNNNAVRLDYADLWHHVPTQAIRSNFFDSEAYAGSDWDRRSTVIAMSNEYEFRDIVNEYAADNGTVGDMRLRDACDAAHAQGIVVFSIAFEAPTRGQQVMRYCASSDAHYYDVDGIDISNAFSSIARTINQLRLIQ